MNRADIRLLPGYRGTQIGWKQVGGKETKVRALRVYVVKKVAKSALAATEMIPGTIATVEGTLPTDVIETGIIEALVDRMAKHRPPMGGISIGHPLITAGSLGVPECKVNGVPGHILTNAHVAGPLWAGAKIGDGIYQPGVADGGKPTDAAGPLVVAGVIVFDSSTPNQYDAAAVLMNIPPGARYILDMPTWGGTAAVALDTKIKKSGRTSGFTQGHVDGIDGDILVTYGGGLTARFVGQLSSPDLGVRGGDSGSAVLDEAGHVVGLVFAGGGGLSFFCPIAAIMAGLGITISGDGDPAPLPTKRYIFMPSMSDVITVLVKPKDITPPPPPPPPPVLEEIQVTTRCEIEVLEKEVIQGASLRINGFVYRNDTGRLIQGGTANIKVGANEWKDFKLDDQYLGYGKFQTLIPVNDPPGIVPVSFSFQGWEELG